MRKNNLLLNKIGICPRLVWPEVSDTPSFSKCRQLNIGNIYLGNPNNLHCSLQVPLLDAPSLLLKHIRALPPPPPLKHLATRPVERALLFCEIKDSLDKSVDSRVFFEDWPWVFKSLRPQMWQKTTHGFEILSFSLLPFNLPPFLRICVFSFT